MSMDPKEYNEPNKVLADFKFPEATMLNYAFSTFDTPPELLEEAKRLHYDRDVFPANRLFSKWFYGGLEKTPNFKDGVDREQAQRAMNWAVCYMRSFAPKHEHKTAVCAFIFNEYLDTKGF